MCTMWLRGLSFDICAGSIQLRTTGEPCMKCPLHLFVSAPAQSTCLSNCPNCISPIVCSYIGNNGFPFLINCVLTQNHHQTEQHNGSNTREWKTKYESWSALFHICTEQVFSDPNLLKWLLYSFLVFWHWSHFKPFPQAWVLLHLHRLQSSIACGKQCWWHKLEFIFIFCQNKILYRVSALWRVWNIWSKHLIKNNNTAVQFCFHRFPFIHLLNHLSQLLQSTANSAQHNIKDHITMYAYIYNQFST